MTTTITTPFDPDLPITRSDSVEPASYLTVAENFVKGRIGYHTAFTEKQFKEVLLANAYHVTFQMKDSHLNDKDRREYAPFHGLDYDAANPTFHYLRPHTSKPGSMTQQLSSVVYCLNNFGGMRIGLRGHFKQHLIQFRDHTFKEVILHDAEKSHTWYYMLVKRPLKLFKTLKFMPNGKASNTHVLVSRLDNDIDKRLQLQYEDGEWFYPSSAVHRIFKGSAPPPPPPPPSPSSVVDEMAASASASQHEHNATENEEEDEEEKEEDAVSAPDSDVDSQSHGDTASEAESDASGPAGRIQLLGALKTLVQENKILKRRLRQSTELNELKTKHAKLLAILNNETNDQ